MIVAGPKLLLFHGRGLISATIRWQTRSSFSHAALLCPDGHTIIEAWQGAGVREKEIDDWDGVSAFNVTGMMPEHWAGALAFARAQVGKGYDYLGVLRFVSRGIRDDGQRWFCSELVFAALESVGVRLLHRIEARAVSPGLIAISPLLIPANISLTDTTTA